jgi:hypothetical protein
VVEAQPVTLAAHAAASSDLDLVPVPWSDSRHRRQPVLAAFKKPSDLTSQLTRDPGLIPESKGIVQRKLIEGDRLVSGEPLDVALY